MGGTKNNVLSNQLTHDVKIIIYLSLNPVISLEWYKAVEMIDN